MPISTHRCLLAGITALAIAIASSPLYGQVRRLDLIQTDATRPASTSVPLPERAAFLRVVAGAVDKLNPLLISDATIADFPFPDGTHHTLRLERFDVIAPTGVVVEGTAAGDRPAVIDKHLVFSGSVDGIGGSFVYLAFFPTYCAGYIELPRPGNPMPLRLIVAPDDLGAARPTMVVFDELDVPTGEERRPCFAADAFTSRGHDLEALRDELAGAAKHAEARPQSEEILVAQIGVECDNKFFTAHASNLSRAANYAVTLMGAVSAVYQRDIRIAMQVPFLRIWTTTTNPYPGPSDGDLLNQIRTYWLANMVSVQRTAAIVMSSYRGGVAWVGTMCGDFGFAQTGPGGNVNFPAAGYVWDVDVVAHELGHNFGSPHTHSCFWNPAVDSCWNAEGGCFPTIVPAPGSIMSYCHLTSTPRLTFHPRVATLIRAAAERYACMSPVPAPGANDVAAVQIVVPANGATMIRSSQFVPSAVVRNLGTAGQANVAVTLTFTNPAGNVVYTDTKQLATLASNASAVVSFKQSVLTDTGLCTASLKVDLPNDSSMGNNALVRPFQVLPTAANGAITVLKPNGGETYVTDSTVTVTWAQTNVHEMIVELSTDNGASWSTVQWSTPGDSNHYQWKVPATPTRFALIRLINTVDSRIVDQSNAPFTITLDKDVQPLAFVVPQSNDTAGSPFTPQVSIRNNGTRPLDSLPVQLTLIWRAGRVTAYDTTLIVPALGSLETRTITFPPTGILPQGDLVMVARTKLAGDRAISNDSLGRTMQVTRGISPPSMLHVHGLDHAATLQWSRSLTENITAYRIYRGRDPEALSPLITVRPTVLAWVDDPIANDSNYYYAVTSVKDSIESIYSPIAMADPTHIIAGDTLRRPPLLSPLPDVRDLPLPVALVWHGQKGAELYQVQIAADPLCADVIAVMLGDDAQPAAPDALDYSKRYYWRVRAFNNSFTGPWSQVWNFTTGRSCANSAVSFDGIKSGALDTNFQWKGGPVTVEFWSHVTTADLSNASAFGIGATDDTHNRFQAHTPWSDRSLYWDYGTLEGDSGRVVADYGPYLDKWTHVALVSNGKDFKGIYLDGNLVASGNVASSPHDLTTLRLGSASGGIYPLKGAMDEFRIWNRVRTDEEIRRSMHRTIDLEPGLVARYRFDEGSGGIVNGLNPPPAELLAGTGWLVSKAVISCVLGNDAAVPNLTAPVQGATIPSSPFTLFTWSAANNANAYHLEIARNASFTDTIASITNVGTAAQHVFGALAGGTTYYWRVRALGANGPGGWSQPGTFKTGTPCTTNALILNGSDDYVDVPAFTFSGRAVTVEWWMYVDSADVRNSWMFYTAPADSDNRLSSHAPWGDKTIYFDYGNNNAGGRISTDYSKNLGAWTHVALVSDGREFKAIYFNGELAASARLARRVAGPRTGLVLAGDRGGTQRFKGRMTEFRIWNTPRSQAAIRENMFHRITGPQSGLLGCWPFSSTSDSVVHDVSGFGHDATLHGSRAFEPGPGINPGSGAISGQGLILRGTTGSAYTLDDTTAASYQWTVIGGTIASGQSTASITVDWGTGTEGTVFVVATKDGCTFASALNVTLTDGLSVPITGLPDGDVRAGITPNPAGAEAVLAYDAAEVADASVVLYDALGRTLRTIAAPRSHPGRNQVTISTTDLPSGSYFCRLHVGKRAAVVQFTVTR